MLPHSPVCSSYGLYHHPHQTSPQTGLLEPHDLPPLENDGLEGQEMSGPDRFSRYPHSAGRQDHDHQHPHYPPPPHQHPHQHHHHHRRTDSDLAPGGGYPSNWHIFSPVDGDQLGLVSGESDPHKSSPPDTFFASHKAHQYFRGAVERYHQDSTITGSGHRLDPPQWSDSPQGTHDAPSEPNWIEQETSTKKPLSATTDPDSGPGLNLVDHPKPGPELRLTRSLIHRLVNPPNHVHEDQDHPFQFGASLSHPFAVNNRPSEHPVPQYDSTEPDATKIHEKGQDPMDRSKSARPSTSSSARTRSKEGLPSNSHHLLNSPELKAVQIPAVEAEIADDSGREDSDALSQSLKSTRTGAPSRRAVHLTPKKAKAQPHQPLVDVPSDDAASILLALSQSEPPKHSMALRRGRGGAVHRSDAPPTLSSPPRNSQPPLTPSGRRYRTRSQISDKADTSATDNCVAQQMSTPGPQSVPGPCAQDPSCSLHSTGGPQHLKNLGYGPPPLSGAHGPRLTGLAGSSHVNYGNSAHSPGNEPFSPYTLVGKPQLSMHGRTRHRVSGCSTTPSTASAGFNTSNLYATPNVIDDDARSSFSISTQATSLIFPSGCLTRRTFPPEVPIDPSFPRLYRAFYVPSAFGSREPINSQAEAHQIHTLREPPGSNYNSPAHGYLDLYTPRFVKGVGSDKVGLCCICSETKERGGDDVELWLKMKVSSYSYHLSFFHGINNSDGLPFSPPIEIRHLKRGQVAANEKSELKEGRCHECNKWIPMEGVKMQEVKVPELFWWKHAKSCHKSRIPGECHVHILDEVHDLVSKHQNSFGSYSQTHSACSTPYHPHMTNGDSPASHLSYRSGGWVGLEGSPAPTCASSVSSSRVHPSVAAQRASAGRVYKRKASNTSLNGPVQKRRTQSVSSHGQQPNDSPFYATHPSSVTNLVHQKAPSPTPQQPTYQLPPCLPLRKTRRSNGWQANEELEG